MSVVTDSCVDQKRSSCDVYMTGQILAYFAAATSMLHIICAPFANWLHKVALHLTSINQLEALVGHHFYHPDVQKVCQQVIPLCTICHKVRTMSFYYAPCWTISILRCSSSSILPLSDVAYSLYWPLTHQCQ